MLVDMAAVDYPEKKYRFELNYFLLSTSYNNRLNIAVSIEDSYPMESVTDIFSSAG
jgi:NADH-quinone oxidoreductase subunit C